MSSVPPPTTVSSSSPVAPDPSSSSSSSSNNNNNNNNNDAATDVGDQLRAELRSDLKQVVAREPLETTWKHLLTDNVVTPRKPTLLRDKLFSGSSKQQQQQQSAAGGTSKQQQPQPLSARLRERLSTEAIAVKFDNPWDKIAQRQEIEFDGALKSAVTLREFKKHEQEALWKRTSSMQRGPNRDILEAMALGLQWKEYQRKRAEQEAALQKQQQQRQSEQERQQQQQRRRRQQMELQQQRRRDELRSRQAAEEAASAAAARPSNRFEMESPRQALKRYTMAIFEELWEMEFSNLGGTNPFRLVIDKKNCTAMGVPDYFTIVKVPMNLTYIKQKVYGAEYETLQQFVGDVNLMLKNALLYNSDPNNDYHLAAKEMRQKFHRKAKSVIAALKKKQQAAAAAGTTSAAGKKRDRGS